MTSFLFVLLFLFGVSVYAIDSRPECSKDKFVVPQQPYSCKPTFRKEHPPNDKIKKIYDTLKIVVPDCCGGSWSYYPEYNCWYMPEPDDRGFHQKYPPPGLVKIPHSKFVDGTYVNKLLPNKQYHFGVSVFDPYTLRCFPSVKNTYGHTSVYSDKEWYQCVIRNDNKMVKYAGTFVTDKNRKITKWDNDSGHIEPKWDGNWKKFQDFWRFSGGTKAYNIHPFSYYNNINLFSKYNDKYIGLDFTFLLIISFLFICCCVAAICCGGLCGGSIVYFWKNKKLNNYKISNERSENIDNV